MNKFTQDLIALALRMQRTCMENHGTSIDAFVGNLIEKHFEPAYLIFRIYLHRK